MSPRTDLRVVMCCAKCEEKAQEEIKELYGVQDVFTDQARSLVTVYGYANTHDVMKKAKKVDKKAELLASESFNTKGSSHVAGYGSNGKHRRSRSVGSINYSHNNYTHSRDNYDTIRGSYLPSVEYASEPRIIRDYNRSSGYNPRAGSTSFVPNDYYSYSSSPQIYRDYNRASSYNDRDVMRDGRDYRDYHGRDTYSRGGDYYNQPGYGYERDDYRYSYNEYRPSQSYPSRYESDYYDEPYSGVHPMNPSYMKAIETFF